MTNNIEKPTDKPKEDTKGQPFYRMLHADSVLDLESCTHLLIDSGYVPAGGVSVVAWDSHFDKTRGKMIERLTYFQAFVLKTKVVK